MSPMRLIILIVAAAAAIGAAFLVKNMSDRPGETVQSSPQIIEKEVEVSSVKVLVAAMDLPIGSLLTPEDFKWADWPERVVNPSYFTQELAPDAIETLTGSVVKTALLEGEPLIDQKVVKKGETGFMAALLSPGMRAISVEISPESASAGFILPDDRVDVILTYDVEAVGDRGVSETTVTRTVIENARVLAIDQMFGETEGMSSMTGSTATLELEPRQAELLAHAGRLGAISLALRSVSDAGENEGAPSADTSLLYGGGAPGGNSVKVFKNGSVSGGS